MKLRFHIGDKIRGTGWTKIYPKLEYADYYRAGGLKKLNAAPDPDEEAREPWPGEVPELFVYDWRGCRMLDSRSWKGKCFTCKWACMANVAIEYNWGVTQKFRFESFCYGPKNCRLYKMGKPRAVPYKDCGSVYDEGWLDEICMGTWIHRFREQSRRRSLISSRWCAGLRLPLISSPGGSLPQMDGIISMRRKIRAMSVMRPETCRRLMSASPSAIL